MKVVLNKNEINLFEFLLSISMKKLNAEQLGTGLSFLGKALNSIKEEKNISLIPMQKVFEYLEQDILKYLKVV